MTRKLVEIWVGVFVVAGIAALVVLATRVGNAGSSQGGTYHVTARFDNIGGLNVKAPVTMAGVRVGRVAGISVDRDDFIAVVKLAINSRYDNLPADTSAAILTAGLLGAQYVGLEPGGEERFLEDGDEIHLTQSAVVLEQLIGQLIFSRGEDEK